MMWFEQKVSINEEISQQLKQVLAIPTAGYYVIFAFVLFGTSILIVIAVNYYLRSGNLRDSNVLRWEVSDAPTRLHKVDEIKKDNNLSASIYSAL